MVFTTTRHEKNIDVVALGEAMVEFNQTSPDQPQYLQGFGGDTSNATIAARKNIVDFMPTLLVLRAQYT